MRSLQPQATRASGRSSVRPGWAVITCFLSRTVHPWHVSAQQHLMQPVTRLRSCWRVVWWVQGWYNITTAPCSMLCSHRWGGTYWYSPNTGQFGLR